MVGGEGGHRVRESSRGSSQYQTLHNFYKKSFQSVSKVFPKCSQSVPKVVQKCYQSVILLRCQLSC
jgi:hypothetical protein